MKYPILIVRKKGKCRIMENYMFMEGNDGFRWILSKEFVERKEDYDEKA